MHWIFAACLLNKCTFTKCFKFRGSHPTNNRRTIQERPKIITFCN